ncbi:phosphoribosyltransferase family protein [Zophobihabitans entericus]|uniref:DNA utilization protein GntX n=1 Tax=Zophobihabitans entericus TaxID=1635327 RepID=A0A6G9I8Y5_9GAMM|nr:phosphoribosyltransferase family protein [Zophobihabitans entericus]QIQ20675.1 DNA utilization protein GntX [Zophobihabitans entericus]
MWRNTLCLLCKLPLTLSPHGICSQCIKHMTTLPVCCLRCGLPVPGPKAPCYHCRILKPKWQTLIAVSDYCEPLKSLIARLKFYQQYQLARPLARLLLLSWLKERRQRALIKPELILPVPLHRTRYLKRGFNQTELLAKPLAHWLNCAYSDDLLTRIKPALEQKMLNARARRSNLRSAFHCNQNLAGKHIMLVDDIVTTGSTINEISYILKQQGAGSIQIICLCRTL